MRSNKEQLKCLYSDYSDQALREIIYISPQDYEEHALLVAKEEYLQRYKLLLSKGQEDYILFFEILKETSFAEISKELLKYIKKKSLFSKYNQAYDEILSLKPDYKVSFILNVLDSQKGKPDIKISDMICDDNIDINYVTWEQWLSVNVKKCQLLQYGKESISSLLLMEIVVNGFHESYTNELNAQLNELIENPNYFDAAFNEESVFENSNPPAVSKLNPQTNFKTLKLSAKMTMQENKREIIKIYLFYSCFLFAGKSLISLLFFGGKYMFPDTIGKLSSFPNFLDSLVIWLAYPLMVGCLMKSIQIIDRRPQKEFKIYTPYKDKSLCAKSLFIGLILMLINMLSSQITYVVNQTQMKSNQALSFFIVLLGIFLMILSVYLAPSAYLLSNNKDLSSQQIIKHALELIKNNFWRTVGFFLSFILWYIIPFVFLLILSNLLTRFFSGDLYQIILRLCNISTSTFYLGLGVYLTPYINLANIFYYRDLQSYKQKDSNT